MVDIQHTWLTPSRIAQFTLIGDMTLEEMGGVHQTIIHDYIEAGQAPVHVIIDIHEIGTFPTNIIKMQDTNRLLLSQPHLGWLIIVGSSSTMQRFLVTTLAQLFKARVQMVATLDDALHNLKKVDPTI